MAQNPVKAFTIQVSYIEHGKGTVTRQATVIAASQGRALAVIRQANDKKQGLRILRLVEDTSLYIDPDIYNVLKRFSFKE